MYQNVYTAGEKYCSSFNLKNLSVHFRMLVKRLYKVDTQTESD